MNIKIIYIPYAISYYNNAFKLVSFLFKRIYYVGSKEEPRTEDSYEPGEIVAYREEDLILRVRVLNNMCTDKAICYTLKVEKVINPHSFVKVVSGGEFKFFKEREFSAMGGLIGILGDP